MEVSVLYFAACPNWRAAGDRLRQALDQLGRSDVQVNYVPVESEDEASAVGFAGSPTLIVDGDDLFGPVPTVGELTCRVYRTSEGIAGVPDVRDLVAALRERHRRTDPVRP